jgi:hypothetical protein
MLEGRREPGTLGSDREKYSYAVPASVDIQKHSKPHCRIGGAKRGPWEPLFAIHDASAEPSGVVGGGDGGSIARGGGTLAKKVVGVNQTCHVYYPSQNLKLA